MLELFAEEFGVREGFGVSHQSSPHRRRELFAGPEKDRGEDREHDHFDGQVRLGAPLFFQERIQLPRRVLRNLDQTLVADLVIDGRGWNEISGTN
jgi:hypothetical protein